MSTTPIKLVIHTEAAAEAPSTRPEITAKLSELTEERLAPNRDPRYYWAKEVTFGHGTGEAVRVDYMQFKPINNSVSGIEKGDFCVYEIKSSVEDFHSKNGHNMIGDYNYYVMPPDVYDSVKQEIPSYVGVLVPRSYSKTQGKWHYLKAIKNAKRRDRVHPFAEMLLMMFRSCARDRTVNRAPYKLAPIEDYDGLKRKYVVLKSDTGEPVEECFVLRPDKDEAAITALLAYAGATGNKQLAADIMAWIDDLSGGC